MPDPIIRVRDVAFPRFSAPDLDVMEAFLTAFGMHRAARTDDALYVRGTDADHHVHVTHLGEPGFVGLAFDATREDLDVLADATGTGVEPLDEPGGGWAVHLRDPDGRVVDNVNGGISHPESQGYGMLLAIAAGDRDTFERIWSFTSS